MTLAGQNFGNDAEWYLRSIPLLEIDDPEIQQIYYYRWKLYRAHIREIGPQGTTVLEFLDKVPWSRQPYTDLNDSAAFHILEGRWLRNPAVVDDLIDRLLHRWCERPPLLRVHRCGYRGQHSRYRGYWSRVTASGYDAAHF